MTKTTLMNAKIRIALTAIISFLAVVSTYADTHSTYAFYNISVSDGLPGNYVRTTAKDGDELIWFATNNGLARYDGYSFRMYALYDNEGNSDLNVRKVRCDQAGTLWAYAFDKTAYYYDKSKDKFLPAKAILDKRGIDNDKNTWTYTDNQGLLWTVNGKEMRVYDDKAEIGRLQCQGIPNMTSSNGNNHYAIYPDGTICRLELEQGKETVITKVEIPHANDQMIYADNSNRIWVHDYYEPGLIAINALTGQRIEEGDIKSINEENIQCIIDIDNYQLMMGTNNNGVYVIDNNGRITQKIKKEKNNPFSIASNHVDDLFIDDNHRLWVATSKAGVATTSIGDIDIETIYTDIQEDIAFFIEDENDNLWAGFDGMGMEVLNNDLSLKQFVNSKNSGLTSDIVIGAGKDRDASVFIGTYGKGFCLLKDGKITPIEKMMYEPFAYARHILRDRQGNIWVATMRNGLVKMNANGYNQHFAFDNSPLNTNACTALTMSKKTGNIFMATTTGVFFIDKQGKLQAATTDKQHPLYDINIKTMICDDRGLLWIGGNNGIIVVDENFNKIFSIDETTGLNNNTIRAITADKQGNIWATNDQGICRIRVWKNEKGNYAFHCTPYNVNDGYKATHFNDYAIYCTNDGDILAGGFGKFIRIHANTLANEEQEKKIIFTELIIDNEPVRAGEKTKDGRVILQQPLQDCDEFTIRYDDNCVIEVSATDYNQINKTRFVCRMDGDDNWTIMEGNRIYLSNLSPGKHKLQVRVTNDTYAANVSTITIKVSPPWWMSGWAYLAYAALALLLLFLIRRIMLAKQEKKVDEAKMRFVTNVGHDIRTPLSLIITPLENLIKEGKHKDIADTLSMMHRNAKSLLNEVNQLLNVNKLRNNEEKVRARYADLSRFVEEVSNPYRVVAENKGISMTTDIEEGIMTAFDANKMKRIIENLIGNAIKYNKEGGSVKVSLNKKDDSTFSLTVADTGIGIKDKKKIFQRFYQESDENTTEMGSGIGLNLVWEYTKMMGGIVEADDNKPQGSVFTIIMPITEQPASEAAMAEEETMEKEKKSDGRRTVLIVEDNDDFRQLINDCLKKQYHVVEAANGKEAMQELARQDIDMVVSDVMMPVMDGNELCKKIKTNILYSHIPVILLTARTADEHIIEGLHEGADDYITKPFNSEILLLRMEKIFQWQQQAQEQFKQPGVKASEISISSTDEQFINKATELVEQNLDNEEFSVERFSEDLCMSRSALYKKLMAITGKSPLEFMRVIRLRKGLDMIQQGNLNISDVAYRVGLSPKQFSKFFKEEYGLLPSEFIAQAKKLTIDN